ncbi:SGNH/GDSL hydrolase family protein [Polymorphobacter fuscus]|uniref:SGNH/GDSL hydrolase family protein n=1 Tax=Sandarakinorhabdus fusca TaxID=1439888 RepID=A0A7C9GX62_9SPHN|nr:SGNH/GDSL hydrolase family protein [Polymorphobacter fuscus]KAB7644074.1 SGNH/GDSL hydrolase family protein [Polymorphobacter fuscus]MQT18449.1 SGNH/GDSL hydrolase family protein [Polymorphobacter fuscus]NJC08430.1 lysophospholipase L1-like esterase [Polymorphobacter fuscus]
MMTNRLTTGLRALLFAAGAGLLVAAAPPPGNWVASWAASQQIPEDRNALAPADLTDTTLRQLVHLSTGGRRVRVLVSNAFGTEALDIGAAHVARAPAPDSARIDPASDRALTFDGAPGVTIPAGASYWSDPVAIDAAPLSTLAITLHLPKPPARQTSHPGSRATSYLLAGNHVGAADLAGARTVDHWYQLASVAVDAPRDARAIVAIGDSITDGHGATTNGNDRWTDRLAERLQAAPALRSVSVLNHGIGGNRVLQDGLGPNLLARFDRDVLAQPGVRYVILLEGINDLGGLTREAPVDQAAHDRLVARITGAYAQVVSRARAAGIKAYGATILPDGGSSYYHPDALNEADRAAVNAWIRTPGNFDAVIDFDALTRDPADPRRMRKDYDSGDGLHPSAAGYRAMADSIPLSLFHR